MRYFLIFVISAKLLFGAITTKEQWGKGETFLQFLEKNSIPLSIYYNLDKEEQELTEEIYSGVTYYLLKNEESGELEQVLIPISEEMQIHIAKNIESNYEFKITPIEYLTYEESLVLGIERSVYEDIQKITGNKLLANELITVYKNSMDFKRDIKRDDRVVVLYEQKKRLGYSFGSPTIKASIIESNKKPNYLFLNNDGKYYDQHGKEIEGFLLRAPLIYNRISSTFSLKRYHPVLKKYRPHYGVDYAAPKGTPIRSAGSGTVSFVGTKSGYGKTVKITHGNGLETLYAHMNSFAKNLRAGKKVKQGELIGTVGSTGVSTGPHLHFGVYRNNRAQDPLRVVKVEINILKGEKKKEFLTLVESYKTQLEKTIATNKVPEQLENFDFLVRLDSK